MSDKEKDNKIPVSNISDVAIYEMPMHSQIETANMVITRVPGGWLYAMIEEMKFDGHEQKMIQNPVFVPFTTQDQTKQLASRP